MSKIKNDEGSWWLVEISHLQSTADDRVLFYEEVLAIDRVNAIKTGYSKFINRIMYTPTTKRYIRDKGLSLTGFIAADAVQI